MSPARPVSWQNPRILSTLLLVFLCGAMAGALAMRLITGRVSRPPVNYGFAAGGKDISLLKLKEKLDLSPEQEAQLRQILDDFAKFMSDLQEQRQDTLATGKARILQVLNEVQRQKFKEMMAETPVKSQ